MARPRITVNGREYDGVHVMPAGARRLYEDAMRELGPAGAGLNGDGIPDAFESGTSGTSATIVQQRLIVNGRTYASPEAMPPEVRRLYEAARAHLASGGHTLIRTIVRSRLAGGNTLPR